MSKQNNPLTSHRISRFEGDIHIPGDKSISHRSIMLGSLNIGRTHISGLLESDDVLGTINAMRALGVNITRTIGGDWEVDGVGIGGLQEPGDVLDMGNSGTGVRLMMGMVAGYDFPTYFTGDESLRSRPMRRVVTPLETMGVRVHSRSEYRLPLYEQGSANLLPITYELPIASAQVKSCIMLAGLHTKGNTTIIEPKPTRDHTERMFKVFGFPVSTETKDSKNHITVSGWPKQTRHDASFHVPADPSSAAFMAVAALLVPGGKVTLRNICMNPHRSGLYDVLKEMGADITFDNERDVAGEPVSDLTVKYSTLKGITIPAEKAPSMIDEYPILSVAAACASGDTIMQGLEELRVKESDRFAAIVDGLTACGVKVTVDGDSLTIHGNANTPNGGGTITTHHDHRIAMSFLVMGMVSEQPVTVDSTAAISTSFPNFITLMRQLGAQFDTQSAAQKAPVKPAIIAIDGPAASGKGTIARRLKDELGYAYLDTGMLYRATGLRLIASGDDVNSEESAIRAAKSIHEGDFTDPKLRNEDVGQAASVVSAIPEVRDILLQYQRNFARHPSGAILDGRDIGTIVCPDADIKIFMTADLKARAERRHAQLQGQGIEVVYDSVENDLIERDKRDSERQSAPLKPADDALYLDTTEMSADEVFEKVMRSVNAKLSL